MSRTFRVSAVDESRTRLPTTTEQDALRALLGCEVEACSSPLPLVADVVHNGLLQAIHLAFEHHLPLVLSPDALWLAIAQGFAAHVNANAPRLRHRFVKHEGKARIVIRRDDFVKGSPRNAWPEVFSQFSDAIRAHIGKTRDLLVCDFSTTGPLERACSEIALLDTVSQYFEYTVISLCGIPTITLEGTPEDWRSVRARALALSEFDCQFWTDGLVPVLDAFVAASEGQEDAEFWRSIYKLDSSSGGPYVTGWVNVLFPYLRDGQSSAGRQRRNEKITGWRESMKRPFGGVRPDTFPSGLSKAPFRWEWPSHGVSYAMEFAGGFAGVHQDPATLAVRPALGWAVLEADQPIKPIRQGAP